MTAIAHRYDFVYLFDVANGNPNGDPDAGNLPRLDPETNRGLVTDVALKRKVRNYVVLEKSGVQRHAIYMQERSVLNKAHQRAYDESHLKSESKKLPKKAEEAERITRWMCDNFYDVRAFGAVMTNEVNAGQVRGPIQLTFATSIDPIVPLEVTITRVAVTNEKDLEKERTMGRKYVVPYALYRAHGFVSAKLAERTGFDDQDLELFWRALGSMFEHDRSAARGEMTARRLVVFEHESALGNAPAHRLFERVTVERSPALEGPARSYSDYAVAVDAEGLPAGVSIQEKIQP
jgi:CRISPR-associated protein Csd2